MADCTSLPLLSRAHRYRDTGNTVVECLQNHRDYNVWQILRHQTLVAFKRALSVKSIAYPTLLAAAQALEAVCGQDWFLYGYVERETRRVVCFIKPGESLQLPLIT